MNDQKSTREQALDLAKNKSIREQKKIYVYYDVSSDDDYYIAPDEVENEPTFDLIETFKPDNISDEEIQERLVEIEDYETITEGTQVLIDGEDPEQVIRITSRQITTHRGKKFRKSDGVEWGADDEDEAMRITHKVVS